jgi:hypothetical protein
MFGVSFFLIFDLKIKKFFLKKKTKGTTVHPRKLLQLDRMILWSPLILFIVGILLFSIFFLIDYHQELLNFIRLFLFSQEDRLIFISEVEKVTIVDLWTNFWIIPLISLFGLVYFSWKKRGKTISNLIIIGYLLPVIFLLFFERRFQFLAVIPLSIFAALALSNISLKTNLRSRKVFSSFLSTFIVVGSIITSILLKEFLLLILIFGVVLLYFMEPKNRMVSIVSLLIIMLAFFSYTNINVRNSLPQHMHNSFDPNFMGLIGQTPKDSCIITRWDLGSFIQERTRRHSYVSSVGQDESRVKDYYNFLFRHENFPVVNPDLYMIVSLGDLESLDSNNAFKDTYGFKYLIKGFQISPLYSRFVSNNGNLNLDSDLYWEGFDLSNVSKVFKDGNVNYNDNGNGCIMVLDQTRFLFFNPTICGSNYVKMIFKEEIEGLEFIDSYKDYVMYRISDEPYCTDNDGKIIYCKDYNPFLKTNSTQSYVHGDDRLLVSYEKESVIVSNFYSEDDSYVRQDIYCGQKVGPQHKTLVPKQGDLKEVKGKPIRIKKGSSKYIITNIPPDFIDRYNTSCTATILKSSRLQNEDNLDESVTGLWSVVTSRNLTLIASDYPIDLDETKFIEEKIRFHDEPVYVDYLGKTKIKMGVKIDEVDSKRKGFLDVRPIINCGGVQVYIENNKEIALGKPSEITMTIDNIGIDEKNKNCMLYIADGFSPIIEKNITLEFLNFNEDYPIQKDQ